MLNFIFRCATRRTACLGHSEVTAVSKNIRFLWSRSTSQKQRGQFYSLGLTQMACDHCSWHVLQVVVACNGERWCNFSFVGVMMFCKSFRDFQKKKKKKLLPKFSWNSWEAELKSSVFIYCYCCRSSAQL